MSKNGLNRHYDKLTPEERFRLDVLATARGDAQESERLVGTRPRFSYTMNDRAFVGRRSEATEIALRVYVPLGGLLARLRVVDAFREMGPYSRAPSQEIAFEGYFKGHESGSCHAWPGDGLEADEGERDATMDRDAEELETAVGTHSDLLPQILEKMERVCVSRAFSIWAGFSAFCEGSMAVAAEKVGAVVLGPAMGQIEDMKARAERLGLEADAQTVEEIRQGLGEIWRAVEERGA